MRISSPSILASGSWMNSCSDFLHRSRSAFFRRRSSSSRSFRLASVSSLILAGLFSLSSIGGIGLEGFGVGGESSFSGWADRVIVGKEFSVGSEGEAVAEQTSGRIEEPFAFRAACSSRSSLRSFSSTISWSESWMALSLFNCQCSESDDCSTLDVHN